MPLSATCSGIPTKNDFQLITWFYLHNFSLENDCIKKFKKTVNEMENYEIDIIYRQFQKII